VRPDKELHAFMFSVVRLGVWTMNSHTTNPLTITGMPDESGVEVDWMKGGGPPGGSDMEGRVEKLESLAEKTIERLTVLDRDVAVIKSNYATKADIAEAKNGIIVWVVSAIFLAQLLPALLKKFGM
jgi:hypothetical protein